MEQIKQALEHFQVLLEEQMKRLETMNKPRKDFTAMDTVTIGICPGDGIGPIITNQAVRILEHLLKEEIANGKIVLKHMINQQIRSVDDVNSVIELYYKNPQKVLNRIILNR